jgi:mevalonate kinase
MNSIRTWGLVILFVGTFSGAVLFAQQAVPPPAFPTPPAVGYYIAPYGAHSQTSELAQQYVKTTKDEDKKEIRKKLVDLLNQQFDQQIQQQEKEMEELEKQIADLKALLKKRQGAKTTIVERRIEQLVQEAEGLGWTAPGAPRPAYGPMTGGFLSRPTTAPARPPLAAPKPRE